jgi:hypothetical protein
MTQGFIEQHLDTRSSTGRDDVLLSELHYRDYDGRLYKVPVGAATDGGSTPRLLWLIPGFEPMGKHWLEYVLHDAGYRGTLQVWNVDRFVSANLPRLQCDQLLERAVARKSPKAVSLAVFAGVQAGGWRHYKRK